MHPQRATPGDPFPAVASSWSLSARAPEKPCMAGLCGPVWGEAESRGGPVRPSKVSKQKLLDQQQGR